MKDPRILSDEDMVNRRLLAPYDTALRRTLEHIDALTEERDRLLLQRSFLQNRARAVMEEGLEWECDCAVCAMVRAAAILPWYTQPITKMEGERSDDSPR